MLGVSVKTGFFGEINNKMVGLKKGFFMKVKEFLKKHKKTLTFGSVIGFINGLLGAGGGSLLVPFLERIMKVEEHEAHATAISVILPLSIVSSILYVTRENIDYTLLLYVAIGGTIGGLIGAKLLVKIPKKWLHRLFGIVLIIASIRMIFS